jgi:Holliday junction resolvasome RuvABC endonuclease subunit
VNILALDLGTKTGYALVNNGVVISGVWDLQGDRFEGGGMRFLRFSQYLTKVHTALHGDLPLIVFEEVRAHAGTDAAHIYGGFMATLTAWCEAHNIPYRGVPVGTIKKHATGKGNANKTEMVNAAIKQFKCPVITHDEADARWLLDYAVKVWGSDE